ncbi:MAG: hypothetical protein ACTSRZ_01830 [Promethearchaeota archaeon]
MIKLLLITDSNGFPFYSKSFDKSFDKFEPTLLSGLISAIGLVGKSIFNEEIATITFGDNGSKRNIIVINKELISVGKVLYFVFITEGKTDFKLMSQLATHIFIEAKSILKDDNPLKKSINHIVERILEKNLFLINPIV